MDQNNQQPYQQQNQPQQQGYSIDYLDQIAPKKPKSSGPKKIFLIAGGGILFLVIILILGLVFSSGSSKPSQTSVGLLAQINTLKDISKEQQRDLRDNVLRNYNSGLSLQLTNAATDLKEALEAEGQKVDSPPKDIQAEQEAFKTELDGTFEEAGLNVQLDRTYAREMSFQLNIIDSTLTSIGSKNTNHAMQDFIKENQVNLEAIAKNLSEFNGAK